MNLPFDAGVFDHISLLSKTHPVHSVQLASNSGREQSLADCAMQKSFASDHVNSSQAPQVLLVAQTLQVSFFRQPAISTSEQHRTGCVSPIFAEVVLHPTDSVHPTLFDDPFTT